MTISTGYTTPRDSIVDRTNWKIGTTEVNILVLAVKTRHSQAPLMWPVLGKRGNSNAPERIALIERYIALFGQQSISMLLTDREFIGADWLNSVLQRDISFTNRLPEGMLVTTAEGRKHSLATLLTSRRSTKKVIGTLTGLTAPLHIAGKSPREEQAVIVATNRPDHQALGTYRKRRAIESLFGNAKTRRLNFEDTRMTDPAKLHLLTAIVALAIACAYAVRAARTKLGNNAPRRKTRGYLATSCFRTGFTSLRNRFRSDKNSALTECENLGKTHRQTRVV